MMAARPQRLYSLDALRGFAAIAVVLWHWQHFFWQDQGFEPWRQPLFPLLRPFYEHGWLAVDLFFCLSGWIFFWLYGEKVSGGLVTTGEFAARRLSRLYPLHLLTLLLVAALQQTAAGRLGHFFVYADNDARHFTLNLLLASGWGFERGASFNGPAWSVSVEALLYAVFFAACSADLRRWWHLALLSCVGFVAPGGLGRGFLAFFVGGLAYYAFTRLAPLRPHPALVACALALAWMALPAMPYAVGPVLFPATVTGLALAEARCGPLGRRLAVLGDVSYSVYLLHFPLQLAFALALPPGFFYSPNALLLFFAVLLPLSLLSYRHIERPAQRLFCGGTRAAERMRPEPEAAPHGSDVW